MLSKRFAGHALLVLLMSVPAGAQSASDGNSAHNAQVRKQFAFEVVSIRPHQPGTELIGAEYLPNGYKASFGLESAIMQAYIPGPYKRLSSKILNAPDWVDGAWYDIDARVAEEDVAAWQQAQGGVDSRDSELLHGALQVVLKERFKLALHIAAVEVPYLNIMVGKNGAKLHNTVPGAIKPVSGKTSSLGKGFYIQDNGKRQFVGVSMDDFAMALMRLTKDRPVQDKTGFTGRYDFVLPWYDDADSPLDRMPVTSIGLMLKPGQGPGFVINIDHIEKPDPN
jgi:uncharacterized protein (TIGR03435 family)